MNEQEKGKDIITKLVTQCLSLWLNRTEKYCADFVTPLGKLASSPNCLSANDDNVILMFSKLEKSDVHCTCTVVLY